MKIPSPAAASPHPRRQQAGFSAILLDMSTVDLEQALRVDLAACYRLIRSPLDDLVFTTSQRRVPGPEHHFLINPYGMLSRRSLLEPDQGRRAGSKVRRGPFPVNPAGFVIHSAIHAARRDAICVLHTHTRDGIAVASQPDGLLPIWQQATVALCSLGYHGYEGIALHDDEKPRLQRDLGDNAALILRNHGLLRSVRPSPMRSSQCTICSAPRDPDRSAEQRSKLIPISPHIVAGVKSNPRSSPKAWGRPRVAGLLRKLDRMDPSYRQ